MFNGVCAASAVALVACVVTQDDAAPGAVGVGGASAGAGSGGDAGALPGGGASGSSGSGGEAGGHGVQPVPEQRRRRWGRQVMVDHAASIQKTAVKASIFP